MQDLYHQPYESETPKEDAISLRAMALRACPQAFQVAFVPEDIKCR